MGALLPPAYKADFRFQMDFQLLFYPVLTLSDQGSDIRSSCPTPVDDDIGVVIRNLGSSDGEAFKTHRFEKHSRGGTEASIILKNRPRTGITVVTFPLPVKPMGIHFFSDPLFLSRR